MRVRLFAAPIFTLTVLRMGRSVLLGLLLCGGLAMAQDSLSSRQAGVTVLMRMALAAGWETATLPRDITASGVVSLVFSDGTSVGHPVIFKAKGGTKFKWEHEGKPQATTIVDTAAESSIAPRGMGSSARIFAPWHFPFLVGQLRASDPLLKIEYLGIENLPEPAYKLRINRSPGPEVPHGDEIEAGSVTTIWISVQTLLPLQAAYLKQAFTNRLAFLPCLRKFSDYRNVGGLMVPFHQEDWSGTRLISTIQFTNVSLNTGLPDSEFTMTGGR